MEKFIHLIQQDSSMNLLDFFIILIVCISGVISLSRGFIKDSVSLLSWILAFFITSKFYLALADFLQKWIAEPVIRQATAICILFLSILIVGAFLNFVLTSLVAKTKLSGTDKALGLVFGIIRGIIIICALVLFANLFTTLPIRFSMWNSSVLIEHFSELSFWFFESLEHYIRQSF